MEKLLVFIAGLAIFAWASDTHALEISHLKTGLACVKTTTRSDTDGWICQPMKDIYIVDQGTCVYDKKEVPCTWTGIEFDYADAKLGTRLACVTTSSMPDRLGNPDSSAKQAAKSNFYQLNLKGSSGHRFEAQYIVFALHDQKTSEVLEQTNCAADGKTVISYTQILHFPSLKTDNG